MDNRVNLIIPGAHKCATSTLFILLKGHPQMCASKRKETNFFANNDRWRQELARYHALFVPLPGQVLFEASPIYSSYACDTIQLCKNIYEYNPNMKFIYLVRDPIDRIVSAYMHFYQRHYTSLGLHEALREMPRILHDTRYYTQIMPFIRQFGRDQVLILDFDDFISRRQSTLQHIAGFLGIHFSDFEKMEDVHVNRGLANTKYDHRWDKGWRRFLRNISPNVWRWFTRKTRRSFQEKPKLSLEDQKMIIEFLEEDITQLEKLLGKSLAHWRNIRQ